MSIVIDPPSFDLLACVIDREELSDISQLKKSGSLVRNVSSSANSVPFRPNVTGDSDDHDR
jgi:hypothetical protein